MGAARQSSTGRPAAARKARRTAPAAPDDELIPVELGGLTHVISRGDIRFVSAQGDYVRLHTSAGSHLIRESLCDLEKRWESAGFVRIHRSTLVARRYIDGIRNLDGRFVVVIGGLGLPVSRRLARTLRNDLLSS